MALPTLRLDRKLEPALASGHPWIYRNHLPPHDLAAGDWVRLEAGGAHAVGRYDAEGPIAVRIFSRERIPDRAWLEARVREALALRSRLPAGGTDAYRLLYGEGDGLPGIVADRYGRFAVVKAYAAGVEDLLPEVARTLGRELRLKGVVRRGADGLEELWGEPPPPEETVTENGLRFLANLYEGQKTGLFLDQRDNRQTLRGVAEGRTVLNLFAYSGGFSVYALAGGATRAVSVDTAEPALRDADRNVALNGLDADRHEALVADVFELLPRLAAAAERYDLVVLDPPSLARAKSSRHAALRAYRRLNADALRVVEPGGLLATASCTSQVPPEAFRQVVGEAAAEAGVRAQVLHEAGHPLDHPVPAAFPEGRYLKFLLLRVLPEV